MCWRVSTAESIHNVSLPAGVPHVAAEDLADAPLYLPYKALVSTVRSMVFSEAEAHRLIEILTEKAGIIQDAWHTVCWWWWWWWGRGGGGSSQA